MNPQSASSGVDKKGCRSDCPSARKSCPVAVLAIVLALFGSCREKDPSQSDIVARLGLSIISAIHSQKITLLLVDEDPNVLYSLIKFERVYNSQDELMAELGRVLSGHEVSRGVIGIKGSFVFQDISPGRYWLVTSEPVVAGDERFFWSHPVNIDIGDGSQQVVLQRSNAAMILDSENIVFNKNEKGVVRK